MRKLNLYAEQCISIMKSTKNISEYSKLAYSSDLKDFIKFCNEDYEIEEDKEAITKRMRWQFIAFMVVALMMSGQPELAGTYSFLLTFSTTG